MLRNYKELRKNYKEELLNALCFLKILPVVGHIINSTSLSICSYFPMPYFRSSRSDLKANFTKKRLQHMGVPVNIAKLLRAPFSFNTVAGSVI